MKRDCVILGAPVGTGAGQLGCQMGPEAYRTAGLLSALTGIAARKSAKSGEPVKIASLTTLVPREKRG